jgi:16S rRNA (guanine527-N7)-methyltransferase
MPASLDRATRRAVTALVSRYELADPAEARLQELVKSLAFNANAPTAVREPRAVVDQHLADSLVALELPVVRSAKAAVDLGSGPGLPGLALAVAMPGVDVVLVESNARKCAFLETVCVHCELANVSVVNARAEAWPDGLRRFDLGTARALAPLEVVVEYAAPMLSIGGALVAWRGRRDAQSEAAAAAAAAQLGLEVGEIREVTPFLAATSRYLHLMSKVVETPSGFPRRPGVAAKRPLGRKPGEPRRIDRAPAGHERASDRGRR